MIEMSKHTHFRRLKKLMSDFRKTLDTGATDVYRRVQREPHKTVQLARRIRMRLTYPGSPFSRVNDRIFVDLADIEEICRVYPKFLRRLLRADRNRKVFFPILNAIHLELYFHLEYHLKGMKKPLELLLKDTDRSPRSKIQGRNSKRGVNQKKEIGGVPPRTASRHTVE